MGMVHCRGGLVWGNQDEVTEMADYLHRHTPNGVGLTKMPKGMELVLLDGTGQGRMLREGVSLRPEQGVQWLDLDLYDEVERSWLRKLPGLNTVVKEALLAEDTRPRAVAVGEGMLIALRGINHHAEAEPDDMVALRLWIEQHRIITSHRRALHSLNDLRHDLRQGQGPVDAGDFLVRLLGRLIDRMSDTIDDLEERVGDVEEQVALSAPGPYREQLSELRRTTIAIRRYLAPQRDALGQLLVEQVAWLGAPHRLRLHEVNDRLLRHIEDLDSVRERAVVAQEELIGRLSEQINSRMYIMSILAAFFLPLTFLTGLLGVNVGGIPGALAPSAFWWLLALLGAVCGVQLWMFRRKGWL
jgi:zinc transporter